ncbi:hypothetical protein CN491_04805 [Bacillus cereus]|uniref:Uncharacterized protein n=1 Tax=Bacillus cereus TaxID=1396 RepID=A0A2B2GNX2_BACCE|nr:MULTISPECIES: hypothetical protein [Bacillus cereus group]MDR4984521.1 hypothetical protein [Bacillus cereus]MEA1010951.1 hypothetical protein [Bacillus cereus]PES98179.1 hypothetical protein CN491_04805 [Bacillus cereus]PFP82899.1 hypothetical protein COJ95_02985 [Bacillus cereus]PGT19820.1 hypothetical protein COC96_07300 [Bacillus cereus]
MMKTLTNYKYLLKNWRYIFICILPTISLFYIFDVIFELLYHQDFYLSNLISAVILFILFINIKDKFKIKDDSTL